MHGGGEIFVHIAEVYCCVGSLTIPLSRTTLKATTSIDVKLREKYKIRWLGDCAMTTWSLEPWVQIGSAA